MVNQENKERFENLVKDKIGYDMTGTGSVGYNDELHIYWNEKTFDQATSVTTLLHDYCEHFDEYFWLRYKALEDLLGGPEEFKKTAIRKELIRSKKFDDMILLDQGVDEDKFNEKVAEIKEQWRVKNKNATDFGTEYHLQKELNTYKKDKQLLESLGIDETFEIIDGANGVDITQYEKAIFPELLISHYYEKGIAKVYVAGQADVVIKNGNELWILDYKTNEKLDFTAFMNKKMTGPCKNHQDCAYGHYTMQLSLYAHFLEEAFGIPVTKTELIHIERDDIEVDRKKMNKLEVKRYPEFNPNYSGDVVHYSVPYDKQAAQNVVTDAFKKALKKEESIFDLENLW